MEDDVLLAAACGLYCGECELRGEKCAGCGHVKGRPYWVTQYHMEVCPVYGCAVEKHGVEHCGLCGEYPCELLVSMRDPTMSDAEYEAALANKKAALEARRDLGTGAWLLSRRP